MEKTIRVFIAVFSFILITTLIVASFTTASKHHTNMQTTCESAGYDGYMEDGFNKYYCYNEVDGLRKVSNMRVYFDSKAAAVEALL